MSPTLSAVIVAAGASRRMGFDKLLTPLVGRPLLLHTLSRLRTSAHLAEVVLVIRPDAREAIESAVLAPFREEAVDLPIRMVDGGAERQDSVRLGLAAVEHRDYVMIQDAARPFLTPELVAGVLAAAHEVGAAVCGHAASDTLKRVDAAGRVEETVDRSVIWQVQTPQIFRYELLVRAYEAAVADGRVLTDDTAAVEFVGEPVKVVPYEGLNLKLTRPMDWHLAAAYMTCGEAGSPQGQRLRHLMHEINNHLTPLLGYSFLVGNDLPEDSKGKKFADNILAASENCQEVAREMQKLIRELFPREEETK
ncbi:MAG: 2-C-methyl-D-erythritol 4-phosphate cytidylyltransferase [Verrucomicrobiota bacterium]